MAKNKYLKISPSKGISIVIKYDIVQPQPPIKTKKKRRNKRINVLPKGPASTAFQQSVGDTSYIKEQPGTFSLWRDTWMVASAGETDRDLAWINYPRNWVFIYYTVFNIIILKLYNIIL
jgi:hypothetical protein